MPHFFQGNNKSLGLFFYLAAVCSVAVALSLLGGGAIAARAQTSKEVEERRAQLEAELQKLETAIAEQQNLLRQKQREAVSLERDLAILDAQIAKAQLEIRARELTIRQLTNDISTKNKVIGDLTQTLEEQKKVLSQLLRKTRERDGVAFVTIAFAQESLSEFFSDVNDYRALEENLKKVSDELKSTRFQTQIEKERLEEKKIEELRLKDIQEREREKIRERESEKKRLLAATRGEEKLYQELIRKQEKTAAEIRAELFRLRGTAAIPFGEALDHANFASSKTGVRPALILGVIAEESNLGENVGTGTWKEDMHPDRDVPVFKEIARVLGLDPDSLPVSKKPWYGWGGAMGPAQFIPSTWACFAGFVNTTTDQCGRNPDRSWDGPWRYEASRDRIRALVGKNSPSNPWEPRDAFMAAAMLLAENGATEQTYEAERLAALVYFAGWGNARKAAYQFYGDDVMALAAKYQKQIDILSRN